MVGTESQIDILIVDDHTLFREVLRDSLQAERGFVIAGEAEDSAAAVAVAVKKRPKIILLDVEIPGDDDVTERVRRITQAAPTSRILILTMHDDPQLMWSLLALGVRGYLLKNACRLELVSAIRSIATQESRVVLSVSPATLTPNGNPRPDGVSRRERDVLELVAEGLSNIQIASRLSIAEGTVKRHLYNTFTKLGAASRIDAVNRAIAASIISPSRARRG
ncbi:DNA-binding response regulator [Spongiactinospora rosea]|uniref:DNA-binding response regulator n=1 Tax=Spongiactinospora rosea TaxID=2248750 RepID=A0A366M1M2_9ACTN|nr:response regulator transcription factor [Spongiactinospora rosea]RBQ20081.1 DNA-binding response regulator [Spongiactinospora rosea]